MVLYFIGVYIVNRTLNDYFVTWNFSSRVERYFSAHSLRKKFEISSQNKLLTEFIHLNWQISKTVMTMLKATYQLSLYL